MSKDELPPWMVEIGRRPKAKETGRPVPPISGSVKVAAQFDEQSAATLEKDFRSVIDDCSPQDEYELNGRILDAMTGNRLSSKQAIRLLRALFAKTDGTSGCLRIDAEGEAHDLDRWGAA